MRVHAIGNSPRYLSYTRSTVAPGISVSVPLSVAFTDLLWADVKNGYAQFKLTDDELATIKRILEHNEKPLPEIGVKPPMSPEARVKANALAAKLAKAAKREKRATRQIELSRAQTPAARTDVAVPSVYAAAEIPESEIPELSPDDKGPVSLSDMKRQNAAIEKRPSGKKKKMTPPDGIPIAKNSGDGLAEESAPRKQVLDDANTLFKGLV